MLDIAANTHSNPSAKLSVLVVDDHMLMRRLVTQQMKTIGFQTIDSAIHGQEALKKMEEAEAAGRGFDIIMLDWGMPIMNGFDLLKKCRSDSKYDGTAFVMLTGECEQKNVLEALQAGATSYIVKPVSQETLSEKIKNVMDWIEKRRKGHDTYLI
ncbi:MAG: response regulator [Rickettsiales bacterium]